MDRLTQRPKTPNTWLRLVDGLVASGVLHTPRIIAAFRTTPRSAFVPPVMAEVADEVDAALPIGEGQTVSQPLTVATMLEAVAPAPGERVLDIGTGSGWQAALLATLVGQRGHVFSVERLSSLHAAATAALAHMGATNVTAQVGDATVGLPAHAPYDIVISAASSPDVPPAWIEQLAPGGRLLHPITGMGLRLLRKDPTGRVTVEDSPGYIFVPLVSKA